MLLLPPNSRDRTVDTTGKCDYNFLRRSVIRLGTHNVGCEGRFKRPSAKEIGTKGVRRKCEGDSTNEIVRRDSG